MEDVEFFSRLRGRGRVVCRRRRLLVSPRRYEAIGAARLTFVYGLIALLHRFGVALPALSRIYGRFCCRPR